MASSGSRRGPCVAVMASRTVAMPVVVEGSIAVAIRGESILSTSMVLGG